MLLLNNGFAHRRWIKGSTLLLALSALAASCLLAQFVSDTRLVVLHASVTDKKGKLITNLDKGAFKVFENGQPQELKVFRPRRRSCIARDCDRR